MTPYKKAVDTNGNIVALLHHDIDRVIILYPVNKTNGEGVEVDIRQCASIEEAMVNFIGLKKVTDAEVEEYNETLFKIWEFSGSNIYQATPEGEKNVEHLRSDTEQTEIDTGKLPSQPEADSTITRTEANEGAGLPQSTDGANSGDDGNATTGIPDSADNIGMSSDETANVGEGAIPDDAEQEPITSDSVGNVDAAGAGEGNDGDGSNGTDEKPSQDTAAA